MHPKKANATLSVPRGSLLLEVHTPTLRGLRPAFHVALQMLVLEFGVKECPCCQQMKIKRYLQIGKPSGKLDSCLRSLPSDTVQLIKLLLIKMQS